MDEQRVLDAAVQHTEMLMAVVVWGLAAFVAASVVFCMVIVLVWGLAAVRRSGPPEKVERREPKIGRMD